MLSRVVPPRWLILSAIVLLCAATLACASGAATPVATAAATAAATRPPAANATATALLATPAEAPATPTSRPPAASPNTPIAAASPTVEPTSGPVPATALAPFDPSRLGTIERDVTYCTVAGADLKMDLYYPSTAGRLFPVTVYIHGGGWIEGDKADAGNLVYSVLLARANFLQVSLNYRLAPRYRFPAQVEDVKCAIRHLRANAAHYNLDPRRIGAWGTSAGAHLAAMLGLTDQGPGWDVGQYTEQPSQVQTVVGFFGPYDLTKNFPGIEQAELDAFGIADRSDPLLKTASPVTYVSPSAAPFLLIHGEQDHFVPPSQSQELHDLLVQAGVSADLVFVKNMGHAFTPVGGALNPSLPELSRITADYFIKQLR
jgi:acetyl esterase/lipase